MSTVAERLQAPAGTREPAAPPGEYGFSCQMSRYRGTLVVE